MEANDFETIFAIFFIIASLSGWYNFVCEVIIRPKIKFYIKKDVKQLSIYWQTRKKYNYKTNDLMEINEFYDVIKTKIKVLTLKVLIYCKEFNNMIKCKQKGENLC